MALEKLSKVDKQQVEPELVPELAGPSTSNSILNQVIFYNFFNLTLFIFHQLKMVKLKLIDFLNIKIIF